MRTLASITKAISISLFLLLLLATQLPFTITIANASHFDGSKIIDSDLKLVIDDEGNQQFDPIANLPYYHNLTQYSYILYYGQFDTSVTSSIISARPALLVTNYYAMDEQTRELFSENNITIIAYLPITWTHRDIDSTLSEARQLLDEGADGLFIDEAVTMSNDWELWYHAQIYQTTKDYDKDKIVIINPGTASINEKSMLVADIICFEHDWRDFANIGWAVNYPGWRFMGISSNEFHKVMGYNVNKGSANQDLEEARHMNIAYHYSADHYIWLPPWLEVYGGIPGSPHPVSDYSQDLDIDFTERPMPLYPAVITETDQAGNNRSSTIIEESPEEEDEQPAEDQDQDSGSSQDMGNSSDQSGSNTARGMDEDEAEDDATESDEEEADDGQGDASHEAEEDPIESGNNSTDQNDSTDFTEISNITATSDITGVNATTGSPGNTTNDADTEEQTGISR